MTGVQTCALPIFKTGANYIFEHKDAPTNTPAFNFRINASRGPSGEGGYITSVQGGFQ